MGNDWDICSFNSRTVSPTCAFSSRSSNAALGLFILRVTSSMIFVALSSSTLLPPSLFPRWRLPTTQKNHASDSQTFLCSQSDLQEMQAREMFQSTGNGNKSHCRRISSADDVRSSGPALQPAQGTWTNEKPSLQKLTNRSVGPAPHTLGLAWTTVL